MQPLPPFFRLAIDLAVHSIYSLIESHGSQEIASVPDNMFTVHLHCITCTSKCSR